ncbi:MAG: hypothetical protein IPK60_24510 [Sandaracinaceae bacterium]|nr:hypothetical protein [Sandaracinaceae bacterium]
MSVASALLLPTEASPSIGDVKRALLFFDELHLVGPDDRELLPRLAAMAVVTPMGGFMGRDMGPVLLLGKAPGFDDDFGQLIDACKRSGAANKVVVRPTPPQQGGIVIGSIPVPAGTPPPSWVFQLFRGLVASPDVMRDIAAGLGALENLTHEKLLGLSGGVASNHFVLTSAAWLPPVADVPFAVAADCVRPLRDAAAARLGALVKALGIAQMHGLHPLTNDEGMGRILQRIHRRPSVAATDQDPADDAGLAVVRLLDRYSKVVLNDEIAMRKLEDLSLKQVLRLRDHSWGVALDAREKMFAALHDVAREADSVGDFDRRLAELLDEYRRARAALSSDFRSLIWDAGSDLVFAGATAASSSATVVQQLLHDGPLITLATLAALGAAGKAAKSVVKLSKEYVDAKRAFNRSSAYAIAAPFRFIL